MPAVTASLRKDLPQEGTVNTVYITSRCALTGVVTHTRITYTDLVPPTSWRTYALEAVGALVFGTACAVVYLAVVVLRVVVL